MEQKLKRDREFIFKNIEERDGTFFCKERCTIEFPSWYMDKGMGEFGEDVTYFGIFAIIMGDKYAVATIPSLCRSNPISITSTLRNGKEYTQLEFAKGDPILTEGEVVMQVLLSYDFFKNFVIRADVPWFITPSDLNKCLTKLVDYAGSNVGINPITNELVVSMITRLKKDPDIYYRQTDMKEPFTFVPLTDLFYSVTSTVNKITGSYMQEGIVSALVKKPTESEATDIEKHLKG